jgi:hypothetical protein
MTHRDFSNAVIAKRSLHQANPDRENRLVENAPSPNSPLVFVSPLLSLECSGTGPFQPNFLLVDILIAQDVETLIGSNKSDTFRHDRVLTYVVTRIHSSESVYLKPMEQHRPQ